MAEKRTILGDTASAGPAKAALRAVAAEPVPDIAFVSLDSDGVVLIYGHDEAAISTMTPQDAHRILQLLPFPTPER